MSRRKVVVLTVHFLPRCPNSASFSCCERSVELAFMGRLCCGGCPLIFGTLPATGRSGITEAKELSRKASRSLVCGHRGLRLALVVDTAGG